MDHTAPTILFIREVPWISCYPISTRRLAGEFALAGWSVIWLNPPLMPWHHAGNRAQFEELQKQYVQGGIFFEGGRVFAYTPRSYLPYSRRKPLDHPLLFRHMWKACLPPLRRVLRRAGMPVPDVLVVAEWAGGGIRDLFPPCPLVFHVTDNYVHFPSVPVTCAQIQQHNYRIADHVIVTAPALRRHLREQYAVPEHKLTTIIHGVELEPYQRQQPEPAALAQLPRPRAIALGNTQWLDLNLLANIARQQPQVSFVIVGSPLPNLAAVNAPPNVYALGAVQPELVPAYLLNSDIGLILYGEQIKQRIHEVAPMKFFEYAAAGLPIIATCVPFLREFDAHYWEIVTAADGIQAVQEALAQREQITATLRAFAAQHTWRQKYEQAAAVLARLGVAWAGTQAAAALMGADAPMPPRD